MNTLFEVHNYGGHSCVEDVPCLFQRKYSRSQYKEPHYNSISDDGDLRLVGDQFGIPRSRRLEIYLQGEWGTVCSRGFSETEAEVACKQLGYSSVLSFGRASGIG